MSVISDVIQEEYKRLNELIELYNEKISHYPKGSISKKKRGHQFFCYLTYRNYDKVKSDYLGKEDSEKVHEISEQIKQRHRYEKMLKKSIEKLKEIKRYMNISKRKKDDRTRNKRV